MILRIFFFLTSISLFSVADAQYIVKDRLFINGSTDLSFESTNYKQEIDSGNSLTTLEVSENQNFDVSTSFGFMLTDRIAAGLGVNYNFGSLTLISRDSTGVRTGDQTSTSQVFMAGPFVRYYIHNQDRIGFFIVGDIMAGNEKIDNSSGITRYGSTRFSAGLGFQYFLNDFISAEFEGKYINRKTKRNGDTDMFTGSIFNLGFTFYLK